MEHPRGFVTQYKYRDHSFEDTLKPSTAAARLHKNSSKEAFIKADGTVLVREKRNAEPDTSMPILNSSQSISKVKPESLKKSEANMPDTAQSSMRKVSSAHFTKNGSARQSKTSMHPAAADGSYLNSRSNVTKPAWCPGHARSRLFDAEPYESVIKPNKFEQTPFQRLKARGLHKETQQDFVRHIGNLHRPFMLLKNEHFVEKPPRTFFNHLKVQFDFFHDQKEGQQSNRAATAAPASKQIILKPGSSQADVKYRLKRVSGRPQKPLPSHASLIA